MQVFLVFLFCLLIGVVVYFTMFYGRKENIDIIKTDDVNPLSKKIGKIIKGGSKWKLISSQEQNTGWTLLYEGKNKEQLRVFATNDGVVEVFADNFDAPMTINNYLLANEVIKVHNNTVKARQLQQINEL